MEQKKPYIIKEQPGTKYYCGCGKSKSIPYCDGAHKGTEFFPRTVTIEEETTVAICSCGRSAKLPFCDGSHRTSE